MGTLLLELGLELIGGLLEILGEWGWDKMKHRSERVEKKKEIVHDRRIEKKEARQQRRASRRANT